MNIVEIDDEIVQMYRNVFSSQEGQTVLSHILMELGFFEYDNIDTEIELKNYAARLINILGTGRVDVSSLRLFLNGLTSQNKED